MYIIQDKLNKSIKHICPLRKSDISSLDFVVNRFFMKLFQTNNIDIVNYCRAQFEFDLPSTVVEKRSKNFLFSSFYHIMMNKDVYI